MEHIMFTLEEAKLFTTELKVFFESATDHRKEAYPLYTDSVYYEETFLKGEYVIKYDISWGDWKHEHARSEWLAEESFKEKNIKIVIDGETTEENDSDCYSATHTIKKWSPLFDMFRKA